MDAREDGLLMSGIQHFAFCRRQWALIHIEQQWQENARTAQGQLDHVRCHDETLSEKRDNVFTVRGMRVFSRKLNLSGACDVVEFHKDKNGISLEGQPGFWLPYPIEYKHGREKETDADRLQLCAQALCLEDMLATSIGEGALFYAETRRREKVLLDQELRQQVREMLEEMLRLFRRGHTPRPRRAKRCGACSLKDACLPGLDRAPTVAEYLRRRLKEEAT